MSKSPELQKLREGLLKEKEPTCTKCQYRHEGSVKCLGDYMCKRTVDSVFQVLAAHNVAIKCPYCFLGKNLRRENECGHCHGTGYLPIKELLEAEK